MKNVDLGPDDYRKQDPKTGDWRAPDDPKAARIMLIVMLIGLAFVFWRRDELSSGLLFGITAVLALVAGGMFILWLRPDRY